MGAEGLCPITTTVWGCICIGGYTTVTLFWGHAAVASTQHRRLRTSGLIHACLYGLRKLRGLYGMMMIPGAWRVRTRGVMPETLWFVAFDWLGGRDSNPDTQIQSLQSYR